MADDTPFVAPLGDVVIPTVHLDAGPLLAEFLKAVAACPEQDLDVHHACVGNPDQGRPMRPTVILGYARWQWIMSAETARRFGFRLGAEHTVSWGMTDRVAVARLFFDAADQAEALAATPFTPPSKMEPY